MKYLALLLCLATSLTAQEPEGSPASKASKAKTEEALSAQQFAKMGMAGSSVGISLDDQGRAFLSHTNRRNNGEIDIRKNKDWLLDSLALTSAEDRQALIKKRMPTTWKDLAQFKEKIIRVEDTDGDGTADKSTVVFEGLNDLGNGLAGGVLWHDGELYVTCMPSLYKLTDKDGDGLYETKQELARGIGYHIGYGGHDMHGPTLGMDGRIYWSTGDKGISVTTPDGKHHYYPGEGGIFRIEPDGTGFEVFAHGLRNPQELAFDEWGNLFTVDNDGDFGDKERLHYVVEGSDSGWRMHYQYRSDSKWAELFGYNPWLADNLWKPQESGQPAYLTPSLANFSVGPIGLEYNPGTALSPRFQRTFFLAESSKDVQAFQVEAVGAGFKMINQRPVLTGPFLTGLSFGPDGALYGADWGDNIWAPHEKGGVMRLDDGAATQDSERSATQKYIAEGMAKRSVGELAELLGHADQRVRLKAQFELVKRGEVEALSKVATQGTVLLGRIHAIWGLGQLGRKDSAVMSKLISLLADSEAEVRAQTARMMADAGYAPAAESILKLLADPSPRVSSLAGIALGRLGAKTMLKLDPAPIAAMLSSNESKDAFINHAGAMALTATDHAKLGDLAQHSSKAVRLAAVVACRMAAEPSVTAFLADADAAVVAEAARAIHDDQSIEPAMPALAAVMDRATVIDEITLRRSISANFRVGGAAHAQRLIAYALRKDAPAAMRAEALDTLALWPVGARVDRVQGYYRGLPTREVAPAKAAFATAFAALIEDTSKPVQSATARLVRAFDYQPAITKLTAMSLDEKLDADTRAVALLTMAVARAPRLAEAMALAMKSDSPALRVAAVSALVETKPDDKDTLAAIDAGLKRGVVEEQQPLFALLGGMKNSKAEAMLKPWLVMLSQKKAAPALALDIYEATSASKSKDIKALIKAADKQLKKAPHGAWSLALEGGDVAAGERIYKTSTTGACSQCHTLLEGVPSVGPNLTGVATRRTRELLLSAIVNPQGEIAEGYGMVSATVKNGSVVSGLVAKDSPTELVLRLPATTITSTVSKTDIATQTQPASAMPIMTSLLTKFEVRDLVAYLATLK